MLNQTVTGNIRGPVNRRLIVALVALLLIPLAQPASAQVKPGDFITRKNSELVKDIVSPGIFWCVNNGMDLDIVPYKKIDLPRAYVEATEKYSDQVTITDECMMDNWVAGRPFPDIDGNDKCAAHKLMWNFQSTHYYTESMDLHLVDADTGSLYVDAKGLRHYTVERHFIPDWLRVFRFQGRLYHDPKPAFEPNYDKTFFKAGLYPLIEPLDLKGVGGVSARYVDIDRHDDTWLYLPMIRRVRRMSTTQRSDALFGQDIDVDSFGGYAGQIPWFTWRYLGEKEMLASLHGKRLPPEPCKSDGGMTFCEPWEMRTVRVVEGKSIFPGYAFGKRVIYLDKETNVIGVTDLYDHNNEVWKVVMISFRSSTKPNPKVDFSYPEVRMFAYAFTVVDTQLMHGTRVAMPGLAFQDEPGWYIDLGFDVPTAAEQSWFGIPALIAAGR